MNFQKEIFVRTKLNNTSMIYLKWMKYLYRKLNFLLCLFKTFAVDKIIDNKM